MHISYFTSFVALAVDGLANMQSLPEALQPSAEWFATPIIQGVLMLPMSVLRYTHVPL
jgi:hypothetical protein